MGPNVHSDYFTLSCSDGRAYEYFESFPINLLDQFQESTGREVQSVIVVVMQYGSNFSGNNLSFS